MSGDARTYLDCNATTPLRPEARAAMVAALDAAGNPSSVHAEGRAARAIVESARAEVAALTGAATPAEVVFTSGGSEAITTVLRSGYDAILVSGLEHAAVHAAAAASGARVIGLSTGSDGLVSIAALDRGLDDARADRGRVLVCLQAANNETGIVQPLTALGNRAKERGADVFCDAVQAAGRIPLDMKSGVVDAMAVSAHKLGGPKGVGAIVIRPGYRLRALVSGGGQERGRRGGTENVAALAGFGAAAKVALAGALDIERQRALRDQLEQRLVDLTPDAIVIGRGAERLANTSLVALPGRRAETLVIGLDLAGVAVSAGAACSSGKANRSRVLESMGFGNDVAESAVRFSLGWATGEEDIGLAIAAWVRVAGGEAGARQVA